MRKTLTQEVLNTDEADQIPAAAASFLEFKEEHEAEIESLVRAIGGVSDEAHWTLIEEMKDAIGSAEANDSSDRNEDQEAVMSEAEDWVTRNCSAGDFELDVAMSVWLNGLPGGEAFLRSKMAMHTSGPRG